MFLAELVAGMIQLFLHPCHSMPVGTVVFPENIVSSVIKTLKKLKLC
jgi:hypothetical protein